MVYFNEQLKKYCKVCPSCKKDIPYFTKKSANRFDDDICLCRSCSQKKIRPKQNKIYKRCCPKCYKELFYKEYRIFWRSNKKKSSCKFCIPRGENHHLYGKHLSDTHKKNISVANIGRKHTKEVKQKMRMCALERIKKQGVQISYNQNACRFIDNFGIKNGYNFYHALNGGEVKILGYSLDGYDKEKNIILEYDESEHEKTRNKVKDLERTKNLIKYLGCRIIRYSEKYNKVYESFDDHSEVIDA